MLKYNKKTDCLRVKLAHEKLIHEAELSKQIEKSKIKIRKQRRNNFILTLLSKRGIVSVNKSLSLRKKRID